MKLDELPPIPKDFDRRRFAKSDVMQKADFNRSLLTAFSYLPTKGKREVCQASITLVRSFNLHFLKNRVIRIQLNGFGRGAQA